MGAWNKYLLVVIASMLLHLYAGANIRSKRSDNGAESNLDSNGFCLTEKYWNDGCNDCFCVKNGRPGCTLRGCQQIHDTKIVTIQLTPENEQTAKVKQSTNETNVEAKCKPGSTWSEECNTCWCGDSGQKYCTKIGCVNLG
ncbi:hypothetical protein Bhyg_04205 [Pseudolycoriella hygida]|uniref:Pacifastin domain-containing protein n=1 Tax=Pseudolycoriella hygida TaxID=35572 RepID=A0A9Q0NEZ0_9DIPT|nr:hypothetical protein Bhyg_04205 [Pseudolycoriella hygida]